MTSRMMMTSKSTQIDCQAVNTQQYLKKPEENHMSQRKNTKADCRLTAQKFKKSKEVFDKYKIQPLEVHVW